MVARGPSQVKVAGPLTSHADGFREALAAQGFSPWSQMFYLHLLADVSRWLDQHGLHTSGLTDANASAFLKDRRSRGRARFRSMRSLATLLVFLRGAGVAPPPTVTGPDDQAGILVAEFAGYLADERGLRPQTVALYAAAARRFLDSMPAGNDILAGLTADTVRSFVIAESRRRGTGSLKNMVTAIRSLLRFLHLRGRIPDPMDGAAPAAAGWHRPPLTRRIHPDDVAAILASCDRSTHPGRRDYAILMLLSRLGLRAGEAAAARIGDIDWRAGEILVRGKGGHDERLPLPPDVGAAIADYCRHARRTDAASEMLFLHARAPYGPITSSTVGYIVERACLRAGLEPASAHQLRHAAATAMRRAGAPLSEISQLLRHQHEGTTSRYGTIDPEELGPVTAPWPQAAS
ncbi:tyrosine-type recombinase/integrase [Nonomuraea sp. M3C6]|uniref:Tyrosine-type recombinase/integrase n=1 Tax=Nonomuraea marmarensis TaxID=3351344 RepID=A0ABW7AUB9_9ACTN